MIVCKIGGSSLSSKIDFLNMRDVILSNGKRQVVVVSAPGKRHPKDEKITDLILKCIERRERGLSFKKDFLKIYRRYYEISYELSCFLSVKENLRALYYDILKLESRDYILSRGEYISAIILANLLNYKMVDAKDILIFNERGKIDEKLSFYLTNKILKNTFAVVPGFYGSLYNGKIKTFPRGGSDTTGAYISAFLNAEIYENMTDVPYLYLACPTEFKNPKEIKELSLYDLKLISQFGGRIFNEGAVEPLIKYNIPLNIKSAHCPNYGTLALKEPKNPDRISGDRKSVV